MRHLLLYFLFLFICISANSQVIVNRSSNAVTVVDGRLGAGLNFYTPRYFDTTQANLTANIGIDSCGAMIFTYADNSYWLRACSPKRWIKLLKTGDAANVFANNGLTKTGDTIQLGGILNQNTDIDLGGDSLRYTGTGYARWRINASTGAAFIFENTAAGFKDNTYFIGENVPVRLFGTSATGFVGFTYYTGGVLRWATGYDGNADHAYIADIRNTPSATIEADGSTFAAFSKGKNFAIGDLPVRDSARINVYVTGAHTTAPDSSMRWFVAQNYGTTFSTSTTGAITYRPFIIDNSASRSSGASNLTNVALFLRSRNAQTNIALNIDSGTFIMHRQFISTAAMSNCDLITVNNAASTQMRYQAEFQRSVLYNDTAAGSETFSSAILARNIYSARGSASLPDNLSGNGGEIALFPRRNTAYTGATIFQGALSPTNAVTTMPTALLARLDISQSQTGGNSLRLKDYWSVFTSWVVMNTGNSIGKLAWINTGAAQETGGTIDTGYAVYINALPTLVGQKYAIYQSGANDSLYINGITRYASLASQNDTTNYKPMVVSANGTVYRMIGWPTGSGGSSLAIGNLITSATQGSVLFAGTGGQLQQSNANYFYDSTNARLGLKTASPSATLHIVNSAIGTTPVSTNGIFLQNPTAAAAGAQQYTPQITFESPGWKTTATAASQIVSNRIYGVTVQGTTAPTGYLTFEQAIAGGSYTTTILTVGVNNSVGRVGVGQAPDNQDALVVAGNLKLNSASTIRFLTAGGNAFGINNGSVWQAYWDGNGNMGLGSNTSPQNLVHPLLTDAVTNAISYVERWEHQTSGTAAAGFGTGMKAYLENGSGTSVNTNNIEFVYTTVTNAAEKADMVFKNISAGTLTERLRILDNGNIKVNGISSGTGNVITLGTDSLLHQIAASSLITTIYSGDGTLAGNRQMSGANFSLQLGTSGSKLSGFTVNANSTSGITLNSDAKININGELFPHYSVTTDANYSITTSDISVKLLTISANRTLSIGTSASDSGHVLILHNTNNTANKWLVDNFLYNTNGVAFDTLDNNTTYTIQLIGDGTGGVKWNIVGIAGKPNTTSFNGASYGMAYCTWWRRNYVFTGSTTIMTLPAVNSGMDGFEFQIKNAGSGSITLNSNGGGNDIYDTGATNTLTITAGSARILTLKNSVFYVN